MPRNKIKQDFHFTTLKGFKIIKLTTCGIFCNKKNILHLLRCFTVFLISFYRINICLLWENIECSPLLVTNVSKKIIPPFDQRQITFYRYLSLLWNTFKILPRHGCISINRQFNSTMENNFVRIRTCSLSYPGAWVR